MWPHWVIFPVIPTQSGAQSKSTGDIFSSHSRTSKVPWRHGGQGYNRKIGHQCHGPKPVGGVNFRAKVGGKIASRVY